MASPAAVAEALATTISDATGIRSFAYVPETISPPALVIALGEMTRGAMSRGTMEMTIEAVVFVQKASLRTANDELYGQWAAFDTTASIWKAVDDNKSLGLANTDAAVLRYRPLGIEEVAAYGYLGGVFEILVLTSGA